MTDDVVHELQQLHVGRARLGEPETDGLPGGWQIVIRTWGRSRCGRELCDALIIPPHPQVGWRTAGELTSARKARLHAAAEIQQHLAKEHR